MSRLLARRPLAALALLLGGLGAVLALPLLVPVERLTPDAAPGAGAEDPVGRQLCGLASLYAEVLNRVARRHREGGGTETAARLSDRIARLHRLCGDAMALPEGWESPESG